MRRNTNWKYLEICMFSLPNNQGNANYNILTTRLTKIRHFANTTINGL